MERDEAERLALEHARSTWGGPGEVAVVPDATIEDETLFMVFCQSTRYVETKDPADMLVGSGGIIVDRRDGRITQTGSALPPETYLDEYKRKNRPRRADR